MIAPALAVAASLALAWIVYHANPRATQNRALAMMLLCQGLYLSTLVLRLIVDDAAAAYGLLLAGYPVWMLALVATLVFYGTLPGPWARRVAHPFVIRSAVGVVALHTAGVVLYPAGAMAGLQRVEWLDTWIGIGAAPLWVVFALALFAVLLAGVPISLSARRHARSALHRRRMNIVATAFITYNGLLLLTLGRFVAVTLGQGLDRFIEFMNFLGLPALQFILIVVLAYGSLTAQLFDVELRLKRTIKHGTVTAIVLATAFVVSELAALAFSERVGPVMGILAAGVLVFAIAPLQRLADRISDTAMPHVQDTPDYRAERAREIYAAAVESAMYDGVITERERDVLATLAEKFGFKPTEARRIERELVEGA